MIPIDLGKYVFKKYLIEDKAYYAITGHNFDYVCSDTIHTLMCSHEANTPQYKEISEMCSTIVDMMSKIDSMINN